MANKRQSNQPPVHVNQKRGRKAAAQNRTVLDVAAGISPEERHRMIAEAAYLRAERRGFAAGGEMDDWKLAEAEIDRLIQSGSSQQLHVAKTK